MHLKVFSFTYVIELVDVVGEEVDDLARGGLSHGRAAETQSLEREKRRTPSGKDHKHSHPTPTGATRRSPTPSRRFTILLEEARASRSHPPTDLPVDHVTHGHSDLHARPLDVVEVEVVEQEQADGAQRHDGGVAQRLVERRHVQRVVALKVLDHLAQDEGLDHFDDLLRNGG